MTYPRGKRVRGVALETCLVQTSWLRWLCWLPKHCEEKGEMEAIPLFLASASKAILLGAVVPEMTSQDGAPNVLDSTGVGDGAAAVAVAPAEAAPMAPEPQVAHVDLPVPPPSEPVQPVHPVQAVPSAETTVTTDRHNAWSH